MGVHFYSVMFDEAYGHFYLYILFVHYKPRIQPKLFLCTLKVRCNESL